MQTSLKIWPICEHTRHLPFPSSSCIALLCVSARHHTCLACHGTRCLRAYHFDHPCISSSRQETRSGATLPATMTELAFSCFGPTRNIHRMCNLHGEVWLCCLHPDPVPDVCLACMRIQRSDKQPGRAGLCQPGGSFQLSSMRHTWGCCCASAPGQEMEEAWALMHESLYLEK